MSAPYRLALFDVDGTLIDSQAQIKAAFAAAFAAEGLALPAPEELLSVVGLSLPVAIRRLVPGLGRAQAGRAEAAYRQAFAELRRASAPSPLYPGALAALDVLSRDGDVLLGVATGKSRRGLDHVLAVHGLEQLFATLQVADHHPSKPHPAMVLAALAETGVEPGHAVMIGDTSFDMEMGRAAGVRTLGVGWGYHGAGRLAAADRVIGDFAELLPALAMLWGDRR